MQEVIQDFRRGLDVRRFKLTAPSGTLKVCTNGHITAGGELEKRKAFARSVLPSNSYGLLALSTGLMIFGSVAQNDLNQPLPANVTYQRLQHPDGTTAMTKVRSARTFGDKTFVVAEFGSDVHAFYDGSLVSDFTAGLVAERWVRTIGNVSRTGTTVTITTAQTHGVIVGDVVGVDGLSGIASGLDGQYTVTAVDALAKTITYTSSTSGVVASQAANGTVSNNSQIAAAFAVLVNATNDYTASVESGAKNKVDLVGPVGADFATAQTVDLESASLTNTKQIAPLQSLDGVAPIGGFTIVSGAEGGDATVEHIAVNGVTILGEQANNPVTNGPPISFDSDAPTTAATIAAWINANPVVAIAATGFFAATGAISSGESVSVGDRTYTFRSSLTPVADEVLIGASEVTAMANLLAALNHDAGEGTAYASGTVVNGDVSASSAGPGIVNLTAKTAGISGNSIFIGATAANILASYGFDGVPRNALGGGLDAIAYAAVASDGVINLFHPTASAAPNGYIVSVTVSYPRLLSSYAVINYRSRVGTTVTLRCNAGRPHGLSVGDPIYVAGLSGTGYNGEFVVTGIPSATKFTYESATNSTDVEVSETGLLSSNSGVIIGNCGLSFSGASFKLVSGTDKSKGITADGQGLLSSDFNGVFPTAGETLKFFLKRVAVNVNANTASTGYKALAVGNTLYLSKLVTTSFDSVVNVEVNLARNGTGATQGLVVLGVVEGGLPVTTDKQSVGGNDDNTFRTSSPVTAIVTEGAGPFRYKWMEASQGSGNGIEINAPTAQTTMFSRVPTPVTYGYFANKTVGYPPVRGTFVCVVTAPDGTAGISRIVKVTL